MSIIEMTRFTVKPEAVSEMLAARRGMLAVFGNERRGFVTERLVRVYGDT